MFRTARDAELTRGIYQRLPVLVDRRGDQPRALWPVRYVTMFHMTNDSAKFRTPAELTALGAYRVQGQCWEKGDARWVPLYEGKMVQAFDHRAASVIGECCEPANPFRSRTATQATARRPELVPAPQFWVSRPT